METLIKKKTLEEFDLQVKKIKYHSEETAKTVFEAAILTWRPKRKEWLEINQQITCVGNFYGIVEYDHYHVTAEEFDDPIYGPEYQIYMAERVAPGTEVELRKFLKSIPGVGVGTVDKVVGEFGLDTMSIILKNPSVLNRLGLSKPAKDGLYKAIVEHQSYENLLLFLRKHETSPQYATPIYKQYGACAVEKIMDNPYALYFGEIIDFSTADKLCCSMGESTSSKFRTEAGLLACLRDDAEGNGNVFLWKSSLNERFPQFMKRRGATQPEEIVYQHKEVERAMEELVQDSYLVVNRDFGQDSAVYLKRNFYAEKTIVERTCSLVNSIKRFQVSPQEIDCALNLVQTQMGIQLANEQYAAIQTALRSPISILTGGPGTGKTQTLTMMIRTIQALAHDVEIRVCAPTGKAAMRVQELVKHQAFTIHRLIGFPQHILGENELDCDFLFIDEFSMCDVQLCAQLWRCVCLGARIVIVGDAAQLPSVGPGLVLRDFIDSNCIAVTELKKVFRQAENGHIISNAHAILNAPLGQKISFSYSAGQGGDFYFVKALTQDKIVQKIQQSIKRLLEEGFTMDAIEVLSPVHQGKIGTDELNNKLQQTFNPSSTTYSISDSKELKIGDKVIQTKNDYALGVFNGETGTVTGIYYTAMSAVQVSFPNKEVIYDVTQVENLDLAYAITIHRSQGSEFQAVIIPVHETIQFNLNRNLLYTAITRAKKRVILIGTQDSLQTALQQSNIVQRNSNLVARLQMFLMQ